MPVIRCRGDLFESGASYLVNAVNAKGVMGAGIAREYKMRCCSGMFEDYKRWCKEERRSPGDCHVFYDACMGATIINFVTMEKPGTLLSELPILSRLYALLYDQLMNSPCDPVVAIPALGCGIGGLDFDDVFTELKRELHALENIILVYEPLEYDKRRTNACT